MNIHEAKAALGVTKTATDRGYCVNRRPEICYLGRGETQMSSNVTNMYNSEEKIQTEF